MIRLIATLLTGLVVLPFFMLGVLGTALIITPFEALSRRLRKPSPGSSTPTEGKAGQRMRTA
ncbi:MAG: hypothetical protein AAF196_00710 [Planctomycetota bacterium]